MKKIIIAVALIVTTVCSQATTVRWGITGSIDTTKFASGTAYLICTDVDANGIAFTTFAADSAAQSWYKSNSSNLGTAALRSGEVKNGALSASEVIESPVGNKSYWLVVVNSAETYLSVSKSVKDINIQTGTNAMNAKWTGSSQMATYSLSSSSIPEPTSAMLMLLGFAGLALKRKRA